MRPKKAPASEISNFKLDISFMKIHTLIVGNGPRGSISFTLGCGGGSINSVKRSNNPPGVSTLPTIAVLCVCKKPQMFSPPLEQ